MQWSFNMVIPDSEIGSLPSSASSYDQCWAYLFVGKTVEIVEYLTVIEKDHLGDWSPEKDCC